MSPGIITRYLHSFGAHEAGSISITAAIASVCIFMCLGVAIDVVKFGSTEVALRAALDSAVLAAAESRGANWKTTAASMFVANAPQARRLGITPGYAFQNGRYEGTISGKFPTPFMSLWGVRFLTIAMVSAAVATDGALCIIALDASESGAFDMNGKARLNAPTCGVQANTKSLKGMTQEGTPLALAASFSVSGGYTGSAYSKPPVQGSVAVSDPYASVPFPAHGACPRNSKGLVITRGSVTLDPGTYCGGIDIHGHAEVTLRPGVYVMVDGSFLISGGSHVVGRDVVIAFTGKDSTLRVWGDSKLDLTSPCSGTYTNFQFFQDRNSAASSGAWVAIGGSDDLSKATWDGVAYFPTQNFWLYGSVQVLANSPSTAIVADKVWLQGDATLDVFTNNTRNLPITRASAGTRSARLVQ